MAFVNLSKMPNPPATRVSTIPPPSGGLNLHDIPWQVRADQSPKMQNMWWEEGALRSRPEQLTYNNGLIKAIDDDTARDFDVVSHGRLYRGWYVFHANGHFYALSSDLSVKATLPQKDTDLAYAAAFSTGAFFVYQDVLYYKAPGAYVRIIESEQYVEGSGLRLLCVENVVPFVPTMLINADPAVGGSGDLYQPVNRLTATRRVTYNCGPETTTITLPEYAVAASVAAEYLADTGAWTTLAISDIAVDDVAETVTLNFGTGITQLTAAGDNNVRITYDVVDTENFYGKLMQCNIAEVYGGGQALCVVLAGCEAQPNAYFWSANTDVAMDASYFPVEHYNLAGDFSNPIVAFGKQQNMLVIFQRYSIGRCEFGTVEVDGRVFITMDYTTINPNIGCDLPKTVQLVQNNLVFAHTQRGVMLIRDSSSAYENNIVKLSTNVEAPADVSGLLYDMRVESNDVCSMDDGSRYWLYANRHLWIWDYSMGGSFSDDTKMVWFCFDNIAPGAFFGYEENQICYLGRDGYTRKFQDTAADSYWDDGVTWRTRSEDFDRLVTLRTQDFGTYEVLKNVDKAIFVVQGLGSAKIDIEYETDHETRLDKTPIVTRGWSLVPRDLTYRSLRTFPFAVTCVRKPGCHHVRHFMVRLKNNTRGAKITFVSAQIYYTYQGVDR